MYSSLRLSRSSFASWGASRLLQPFSSNRKKVKLLGSIGGRLETSVDFRTANVDIRTPQSSWHRFSPHPAATLEHSRRQQGTRKSVAVSYGPALISQTAFIKAPRAHMRESFFTLIHYVQAPAVYPFILCISLAFTIVLQCCTFACRCLHHHHFAKSCSTPAALGQYVRPTCRTRSMIVPPLPATHAHFHAVFPVLASPCHGVFDLCHTRHHAVIPGYPHHHSRVVQPCVTSQFCRAGRAVTVHRLVSSCVIFFVRAVNVARL